MAEEQSAQTSKLSITKTMTQEQILKMLDWSYDKTIEGLPGQKNIYEFVNDYLKTSDKETAIKKMIRFQTTKAATSGFATGFGGFATMMATIPADIAMVTVFQMRMVAAIAIIRGYELKSDQVRTFVYAALAGSNMSDIVKKTGINISDKIATGVVQRIPGSALTKINKSIGFRFLTKFGSEGSINLGKMIPMAGALFGSGLDIFTTRAVASFACRTFSEQGISLGDGMVLNDLSTRSERFD
ncbi:EcsC family protein [Oenococcus sicerae]|uniref:EcsC family protein n=1 Tax=Oenococcus sicerae TaxID=2203724 RepID=UPI0039E954E0